jgi:hypothetical protein
MYSPGASIVVFAKANASEALTPNARKFMSNNFVDPSHTVECVLGRSLFPVKILHGRSGSTNCANRRLKFTSQ